MYSFEFNGSIVDCIDVSAHPELGFNFPFKIIIPRNVVNNPELVYVCNLPVDKSGDSNTFDELVEHAMNDLGSVDFMHLHLCLDNGYPMVIPAVPKIGNFRPNFLGRDCFLNDFSKCNDSKFKDDLYKYTDIALQHKNMIDCAVKKLRDINVNVDDKVIISGYSEGSKFASHFALTHPEVIKAVIGGGTGGTMSMPVSEVDGYEFVYPTGIADFPDFNEEAFKQIAFFYYMGKNDTIDPAIPYFDDVYYIDENGERKLLVDEGGNRTPMVDESGNQVFKLDENGNYTAKYSLYSDEEVNAINKALGTVIQKRFLKQKEVYKGLISEFNLYEGNHRTVFNNKNLYKDVDEFIAKNLTSDRAIIR